MRGPRGGGYALGCERRDKRCMRPPVFINLARVVELLWRVGMPARLEAGSLPIRCLTLGRHVTCYLGEYTIIHTRNEASQATYFRSWVPKRPVSQSI